MQEFIKIVENNISVDIKKLKEFIINEWQSGLLNNYYSVQGFNQESVNAWVCGYIGDTADEMVNEIQEVARKQLSLPNAILDWQDKYLKSDIRSIGFEVLSILSAIWDPGRLLDEDIPAILEFLDTPPGKSLEAWDKWEKYWQSLDFDARHKKLLVDIEN